MRVVASLTTMPDKMEKLEHTLVSLRDQTYPLDAIILGLPYRAKRLDKDYPDPSSIIKEIATIVRVNDYGPITKIVGALTIEEDPDTVIITFDDDMIYPPTMVEELVKRHQRFPNSAIGSSGMLLSKECPLCAITPNEGIFPFNVPKFRIGVNGRRVDSIYGYPGALYVRKFFPRASRLESKFLKYSSTSHDMLMNDDIVISGYLSRKGVERRIFCGMPEVGFVLDEKGVRQRNESEISYNLDMFFQRMNRSIVIAKSLGMYQNTETMFLEETIVGVSAIFIITLLLLITLIILYFLL